MSWTNEVQPFGPNRAPLLTGVSSSDGVSPVPVAVDPTSGAVLTSGSGAGSVTANQGTPNTVANSWPVEITDGTNVIGTSTHPLQVAQTDQMAAISIAANNTTSGTITGLSGVSAATIQLTGTFSATVQIQVTVDGTNWVNVTGSNQVINAVTGAYISSGNLTAVGIYQVDVAGCSGVQVKTTAYTSGTVAGEVRVTNATAMVSLDGQPTVSAAQSGTWTTGSKTATLATGQKTLGSSSTQLTSTSAAVTNGIIVQALSTNAASVYVGVSGVTTSTGFELQPGQAVGLVPSNQNVVYGVSTNGTDGVCWVTT